MNKILMSLVLLFLGNSAFAIDLTNAKIRGNGCQSEVKIENTKDAYIFPLILNFNKSNSATIERKTCNLRLPVKLGANQKLLVSEALQNIELKSVKGTKIKANLKISILGQKSKEISVESESEENKKIYVSGLVTESTCGKDAMLSADLSVFAAGPEAASAKLDALSMQLKVVNCK